MSWKRYHFLYTLDCAVLHKYNLSQIQGKRADSSEFQQVHSLYWWISVMSLLRVDDISLHKQSIINNIDNSEVIEYATSCTVEPHLKTTADLRPPSDKDHQCQLQMMLLHKHKPQM